MTNIHPRLLCLGFGYTAQHFARFLSKENWRVLGTTRSAEKAVNLAQDQFDTVLWDGTAGDSDQSWLDECTALIISTPPGEKGCPALNGFHETIAHARPKWIGYLSSNGVYGNHNGALVDENTPPAPTSKRAQRRYRAEQAWQDFGDKYNLPVNIFRLPGIYGPGRSALDRVKDGSAKRINKDGHVFNRIHVDDIARALWHSLSMTYSDTGHQHNLFNLCDDEASPPQDVITYACDLLGVEAPPLQSLEEAELSPMGRSFYDDTKRVSNARMKEILGVKLRYPTYREGLTATFIQEKT